MTIEHVAGQDARSDWAADKDRSRLRWLRDTATGKRFYVLRQRGEFRDLCYDHGRLLGPWIGKGVFPEILDTIAVDTDTSLDALDIVPRALFRKIVEDIDRAQSGEMQDAVRRLHEGFRDSGAGAAYELHQVRAACLAIDAGNVSTGFVRRVEKWGADWPDEEIAYLRAALAAWPNVDPSLVKKSNFGVILALLRRIIGGAPTMGCTGVAAAPDKTADGAGLHGRNFDGAFFAWNNVPGIHLFDETPVNPAWHRYAAIGTAGLIYPGGISGLNEVGIGCSLHQMSTTTYTVGTPGGGWDIAPWIQQRILREASSLDEAIAIAEGAKHFASWAIVVSDARAGKSVSIEVNGRDAAHGGQRIGVVRHGATAVQSNHFRAPGLVETFDHFGDAHFTHSLGKWMETRARLTSTGDRLKVMIDTGQLGTETTLQMLAGHVDGALPKQGDAYPVRSFGRTACKAYGIMTSIARADGDRARRSDQFWFTVGDRLPGPHSAMVGFDIDWGGLDAKHRAATLTAKTMSAGQLGALENYVAGHAAYVRPRKRDIGGAGEAYVGRSLTKPETAAMLRTVVGHLDAAVDHWRTATGEPEVPFHYARARANHALGTANGPDNGALQAAKRDWDELLAIVESPAPAVPVHDYEKALVWIHAAATANALGDRPRAKALAAKGEAMRVRLKSEPGGGHPGLSALATLVWEIDAQGKFEDMPDIDFVTVE